MKREQLSAFIQGSLEKKGWDIKELALTGGMNYEMVRRSVKGLSSPSIENADKILRVLGYKLTIVPIEPETAKEDGAA